MVVIAMHNRICTYRCSISHTMKLFCAYFSYAYVNSTAPRLSATLKSPCRQFSCIKSWRQPNCNKGMAHKKRPERKICATQSGRQEITLMVGWFWCQHKFTYTWIVNIILFYHWQFVFGHHLGFHKFCYTGLLYGAIF